METFKKGDTVYIKSDYEKNTFKRHVVYCCNKEYAIITTKNNSEIYKKIPLNRITKYKQKAVNSEIIKKGDLVKCVVDNSSIREGIVIEVYNTFILILVDLKKKKISKNRVIVINK